MSGIEIFKPVKGYEKLYEVSNRGRIFGVRRTIKANHRGGIRVVHRAEKKPTISDNGYCVVVLYKENKQKRKYVHRLVAEVFHPNKDKKREVNHEDGVKTNNRSSNLVWATHKENDTHARTTGLHPGCPGKPVNQLELDGTFIAKFKSAMEAARRTGANRSSIQECCAGKRITTGGYKWSFAGKAEDEEDF